MRLRCVLQESEKNSWFGWVNKIPGINSMVRAYIHPDVALPRLCVRSTSAVNSLARPCVVDCQQPEVQQAEKFVKILKAIRVSFSHGMVLVEPTAASGKRTCRPPSCGPSSHAWLVLYATGGGAREPFIDQVAGEAADSGGVGTGKEVDQRMLASYRSPAILLLEGWWACDMYCKGCLPCPRLSTYRGGLQTIQEVNQLLKNYENSVALFQWVKR